MVAHRTDVFCIILLIFSLILNIGFNCNNDYVVRITTEDIRSWSRENCLLLSLLRSRGTISSLKVPYFPRKCLFFMLLIACGDVELCPGPVDPMVEFLNTRGIKIVHQNIRGLFTNMGSLTMFLEKYKQIDIITLSETHITPDSWNDNRNLYNIPGYTFIQKCRKHATGGGVGMYISNNLQWKIADINCGDLESIWIEICVKKSKNFLVNTTYKPPDTSKHLSKNFNELFENMLITANTLCQEIIALGDMNVNFLDKSNNKEFKTIVSRNGFQQLIKSPTRVTNTSSTLIDIILSNKEKNIVKTLTSAQSLSDHDTICCVRKINHNRVSYRTITCRNFRNYDPNALNEDISSTNFSPMYKMSDVNDTWRFLKNILIKKFNKHAPIITKRVKGSLCPWLTLDIKSVMNNRDKLLRKFRKSKSNQDWVAYKHLRNTCTNLIRRAKSDYYRNLLTEHKTNPQSFWKTIKKIFPGKNTSTSNSDSTPFISGGHIKDENASKSNIFCKYFTTIATHLKKLAFPLKESVWTPPKRNSNSTTSTVFTFGYVTTLFVERELKNMKRTKATGIDDIPTTLLKDCRSKIAKHIAYIINLSLQTASVPSDWKTAVVTPIHKSGSLTDANNYRPISVLPVVSKILEKAVQQQLTNYLEENNLLSTKQFGYRKNRSTEIAATLFIDNIRKACDKGLVSGAIFVDLSKAFDTLGHENLLYKLENFGIKGIALRWFTDYLFSRQQVVKFNNKLSDPSGLMCGVPQGSILGPILFLMFFNDFEQCLKSCDVIQFADDTVIYYSAKTVASVQENLNTELKNISTYFENNQLIINLKKGKTECMLMGTAKRLANGPEELELYYNNKKINCTTEYKYLGTHIDRTLNLGGNFDQKVKKTSSKLYLLKRLRPLLTQDAAITVYKSYVLSALKFNCIVQLNLTRTQKNCLKNLGTRASVILNSEVSSIEHEIYRHATKLVRKCIEGTVCDNLKHYFFINQHNKRTRNNQLITLPKVRLELARSGFFFMGAKLYNLLPREIKQSESDFNNNIKNFDFSNFKFY